MVVFEYKPLDSKNLEIRLVELLPAPSFEADICCNLVHASLNEKVEFLPLSYTWGAPYAGLSPDWDDPTITRPISINGLAFQVRLNLESALRHIRQARSASAILWIDAICINQNDIRERNNQVQLMSQIYSKGEDTVMWLGPKENDSSLALQKMSDVMASRLVRIREQATENYDVAYVEDLLKKEIGCDKHCWEAIYSVLSRFWWNRAWIFQEAIVSPSAIVLCGSSFAWWEAIAQTVSLMEELADSEDKVPDQMVEVIGRAASSIVRSIRLVHLRKSHRFSRPGPRASLETFAIIRDLEASDPRDKVYAALGLLNDDRLLVADYSLTMSQVYSALARSHILKHQNLDILDYCIARDDHSDLPTWAPDWRRQNSGSPLFKSSHHHGQGWTYSATDRRRLEVSFCEDLSTLSVKGCIVTTIEALGQKLSLRPPGPDLLVNESAQDHWTQIQQWKHVAQAYSEAIGRVESLHVHDARGHHLKYPFSYDSTNRAFHKTLFADVRLNEKGDYNSRLSDEANDAEDISDMSNIPKAWEARNTKALMIAIVGRRFFISREAYIGLAPDGAEEGDLICAIFGGEILYVVRRVDGNRFRFIGGCYVHGLMDGQAMNSVDNEKLEIVNIDLI